MRYVILCEVWGGVTGSRHGLLKNEGTTVTFDDRESAQAKADELMNVVRHNAQASFRYTAVPL